MFGKWVNCLATMFGNKVWQQSLETKLAVSVECSRPNIWRIAAKRRILFPETDTRPDLKVRKLFYFGKGLLVRLLSSRPWLQQPFCGSITGGLSGLSGSGQRFVSVPVAQLSANITYRHVHVNVNMLTANASTALRKHAVV